MAIDYRVTIGGVEVGTFTPGEQSEDGVLLTSFDLNEAASRINSLSCQVFDAGGSPLLRPQMGQDVVVLEDDGSSPVTTLFAGKISRARERGLVGPNDSSIVTAIEATDYKGLTEGQIVEETFPAGTDLKTILEALVVYLSDFDVELDPSQATGPTLPGEIVWDLKPLPECLRELSEATGWVWEIDYDKTLRMYQPGTLTAPWDLIEGDGSEIGDVESEPVQQDFYDRIIVKAGPVGSVLKTETFTAGTGGQTIFPLTYTVNPHPIDIYRSFIVLVTRNGVFFETLGTSPAMWSYDAGTNSLVRNIGAVPEGQTVEVTYHAKFPITVEAKASPYSRTKIVVREDVLDKAQAQEIADNLLAAHSTTQHLVTYATTRSGLKPGMVQTITIPRRNISGQFLITEINTGVQPNAAPGDPLLRRVTAVGGGQFVNSWRNVYEDWLGGGSTGGVGSSTSVGGGGNTNPGLPVRSLQFHDHETGSFAGHEHVLHDKDFSGDTYGVEDLPARVAIGVTDESGLMLALWNAANGREDALTFWQLDAAVPNNTTYIESSGELALLASSTGANISLNAGANLVVDTGGTTPLAAVRSLLEAQGLALGFSRQTSSFTVSSTGSTFLYLCDTSSGPITATLRALESYPVHPNTGRGWLLTFKNIGANTLTIDANDSETITDGLSSATTLAVAPGETVWLMPVGTITGIVDTWHVIARNTGAGTSGSTFAQLRVATVTLTDAQIKALPTTYIEVVPQPPSGYVTMFHGALLVLDAQAGAYTNITAGDEAGLAIAWGDWEHDASKFWNMDGTAAKTLARLTPYDPVPTSALISAGYPPKSGYNVATPAALKVIAWNDDGDYTGGNAANTLKVTVYYTVEAL